MNTITGFPRSGSTLLCNILNQNPKFHASSTSVLPGAVVATQLHFSNIPEFSAALEKNRELEEERFKRTIKGMIDGFYFDKKDKLIFDKSRAWIYHISLLESLFKKNKNIILIRDIRNVLASCEKQNRKTGLFRKNMQQYSAYLSSLLDINDGVVGAPVVALQSHLQRSHPTVILKNLEGTENNLNVFKKYNNLIIKYEDIALNPELSLKVLYSFLDEEYFEHDFENIVNTATDPDGIYLFKYPHQGSGTIKPSDPKEYKKYMSDDLSFEIVNNYKWFYEFFEYEI